MALNAAASRSGALLAFNDSHAVLNSDLAAVFFGPHGEVCFIELKAGCGRLSEFQCPPPDTPPELAGEECGAATAGGGKSCDWYCGDWVCGGREYCGRSRRSTAGGRTEPVASGCEAKGLEKELSEKRVCISALQPAKPTDNSVSTATCGIRRERSNSAIRDMVTTRTQPNTVLSKRLPSK